MTTIDAGYALEQLRRALSSAETHPDEAVRARAEGRVRRWEQVLAGLTTGSLAVGSRTPLAGVPAWATLEVATGGFATGELLAGGELQPHEHALLARLGGPGALSPRAALNVYFLGAEGRAELAARLADGRYRVQVPEEGALLVVQWLLDRRELERAQEVLDAIAPWIDRLRFYPVLDERPLLDSAVVCLRPLSETVARLEALPVPIEVARMNESLTVWSPLLDRMLALFAATVVGEPPVRRLDASGQQARDAKGALVVDGGLPCQVFPPGWHEQARALHDEVASACAHHTLCQRPHRPGETFDRMRGWLAIAAEDPSRLGAREAGLMRGVMAACAHRRGAPGSERLLALRRAQAEHAARPTHRQLGAVVAHRLRKLPLEGGFAQLDEATAPLGREEAAPLGCAVGTLLPASIQARAERSLEAPIETLVERGLVGSSEVLARVLPQMTAQVRAAALDDPAMRRLYGAIYAAFRRRRSLLLLNLERQVQLDELPWVRAIEPFRRPVGASDVARQSLAQVATLSLGAFPQTILPNKLIQELHALVRDAALALPLVEELAVDIFMGTFSPKFTHAARLAAALLQGSLYERYYALPFARVEQLEAAEAPRSRPATQGQDFAALCVEVAGPRAAPAQRFTVRNGMILEAEQLLTTHNLAALFSVLDLRPALGGRLPELAQQCLRWCCRQSPRPPSAPRRAELQRQKNVAYAWRQMIFFLSLVPPAEVDAFLAWATAHLGAQRPAVRAGLEPALLGLGHAARSESIDPAQRLLGWRAG